jgi:prepilin-type processing-associated H-X9-DG protein
VLTAAGVLLGAAVIVVAFGGVATQTDYGRERVRSFLAAWLASKVNGTMHIGRVRGGFLGGVTVDSLEIRDDRGEVFIASGLTTIRYDVRDLFDRRVLVNRLELTNPVIHFREYHDGTWNHRRIFPGGQPAPIGPRRGFGDFVLLQSAQITNGLIMLSLPWRPPSGASEREGARLLRQALDGERSTVRETAYGPVRSISWTALDAELGHTRLAHPDTVGRYVTINRLSAVTNDPPFSFRDVRGVLRQLGDSLWFESPEWHLPGSSGSAEGKLVWGSNRPMRYAIGIRADTASLSDLWWIDPAFPTQGGGRALVSIRNAAHNERIIEYVVTEMDVRSYRSRLRGRMVIDPSGPVLAIRDMAVRADPLDFELLRAVNGGPFPIDWRGAFTGDVVASGGRLDRFRVDRVNLTFADGHVRGATAVAAGSGIVDVSEPAFTRFHGFRLNIAHFDMRTPRAAIPDFAELDGFISGTVTLDSLWTDVRIRDADLVHRDGDGPVSHITGAGRVTLDEPNLRYDLDMYARQLSFTTLSRSYPSLPLTGEFRGPLRVRGEVPALYLNTELENAAGRFTFEGIVDAEVPSYGARGTGVFSGADLSRLLRRPHAPVTSLTGRYTVDLEAADLNTAVGRFAVELDSSTVRDVQLRPSFATGELRDARLTLDTAAIVLDGGAVRAGGTIALASHREGSLRFDASLASLAAARQLLAELVDSIPDLGGELRASGELRTGPAIGLAGDVRGRRLVVGDQSASRLEAIVDMTRGGGRYSGTITLAADTVETRGFEFTRVEGAARLPVELGAEGAFHGALRRGTGMTATLGGRLARSGDTSSVFLDTLDIQVDPTRSYRSTASAAIRYAGGFFSVDSLILAPVRGPGSLVVRDLLLSRDSLAGTISSRETDLGLLVGVVPELQQASGPVDLQLALAGSRSQPRARGSFRIRNGSARISGARYERVNASVELEDTSLRIDEIVAETPRGGSRRGVARVRGTIDLTNADNPIFDLVADARGFRAIDRRGFATMDISTEPSLQLVGPYRAATLRGSVIVEEGTIYLPERPDKDIADITDPDLLALIDVTPSRTRSLLPSGPSEFITNLRLDDVSIVLGDDVWLRSSEANVELGGSLRVTRGSSNGDDRPQLVLVGNLNAVRGTYVLNLTVAQPTFHVERGTLRFFGTADLNPTLDIRAIHTVRQPRRTVAREDVRILATITGNLNAPQLALSSADGLALSQSDLLSYLVTGEPAFALSGTSTEYAEQLLTLGGRLAGTYISARIPRSLFDIVEVRTAAVRLESGSSSISSSYLNTLYNTRVILGKQLSDRWYMGLSTGLCRANFTESLGLHLEYRFSSNYFAQGGIEPGSGDVACVGTTTARMFQQTPPQLGVDLFRSWRF